MLLCNYCVTRTVIRNDMRSRRVAAFRRSHRRTGGFAKWQETSGQKARARTAEQPERGGVQSVKVAARILKALAFGGGALPLRDLASATGLARAKVHRYLTSLRNAELVSQNMDTGQYQIGPAAVAIGLVGLRRISPVAEVCGALPALRDLINQTVTVAVWSEAGPVVVAMQESDDWITMNIRVGSRLPILTTAIGRTFLAHLPDAVVQPLVALERKEAKARGISMPSNEELDGLTNEIRLRRLSRAPSALFPGVDAIAAPVFDYRNQSRRRDVCGGPVGSSDHGMGRQRRSRAHRHRCSAFSATWLRGRRGGSAAAGARQRS